MAIITSLLDTDFYKLTMGQLALHQFPTVTTRYKFKCRTDVRWTIRQYRRICEEVEAFCELKLTKSEELYLRSIRFLKDDYVDFLSLYKPDLRHINVDLLDGELYINIEGPWFLTIYWEVPVLAIVNQVYFENRGATDGPKRLNEKIGLGNRMRLPISEFGTRRRWSRQWQDFIVAELVERYPTFVGTSNVALSMKYETTPIGTMAHELFQVGQGIDVRLRDSQKRMLQAWTDEYRGDLGIALTDTIGIDAFLKDFDLYFAKLYDGLRHDSGNPYIWADKVLNHYEKLGIDPKTKTLVFSDGLNFLSAAGIYACYRDATNVSFGIGTNLTNDFAYPESIQIVMKVVEANGQPVAKISDNPAKMMCEDEEYISYLRSVFNA